MGDHQQRGRKLGQQLAQRAGEPFVQAQRGLVQQRQFGHVGQRQPQHHALFLAARQLRPETFAQLFKAERARHGGVGAVVDGPVQRHHLADAGLARQVGALQQAADALARGGAARVANQQRNAALVGAAQAEQGFDQHRLAAAVAADQCHPLAAAQCQVARPQREGGGQAQLQVRRLQHHRRVARHGGAGRRRYGCGHGCRSGYRCGSGYGVIYGSGSGARYGSRYAIGCGCGRGAGNGPRCRCQYGSGYGCRCGCRCRRRHVERRAGVDAVLQQHVAGVLVVQRILHRLAQLGHAQVAVATILFRRVEQQGGVLH